jgi:hypothetical protein
VSAYGSTNLALSLIVPPGIGFGGVGYAPGVSFLDFLGDTYGGGSYGTSILPRPPYPVVGGYGGDPYGTGPYGSLDLTLAGLPQVDSAISVDGFTIDIYFSHEMLVNADLLDSANYIITPVLGAAPVVIEAVIANAPLNSGTDRVTLQLEGTTLGGYYQIDAINLVRRLDNVPITVASPPVVIITYGEPPALTSIDTSAGNLIVLTFEKPMMPEEDFSGIEEPSGYLFSTSYPINIAVNSVDHPYLADDKKIGLSVEGQTSVSYSLTVGPSTAFSFISDEIPSQGEGYTTYEVGTGTSTVVGSYLSINKEAGNVYGWTFIDLSGKVQAQSTFRVDFNFSASNGSYTPALSNDILGVLFINDSQVQVSIILEYVAGVPYLTLDSGTYNNSVQADWYTAFDNSISLVRNQRANTYTLLLNGTPLLTVLTSLLDGVPAIPRGCQFLLTATHAVEDFLFGNLSFNVTQTIFSQAWNFIHNWQQLFIGTANPSFSSNKFLTANGPLVKSWGDDTPATKNDVKVYLNNVEVEVADVNYLYGEIELSIPIPFTTPGTNTVEVDYYWMKNPVLEFPGYNIKGAVLNKNDHAGNITYEDQHFSRFRYTLVFPGTGRRQPPRFSYRFVAFQSAYTAVMNDASSLVLNQDPHSIAIDDFSGFPVNVVDNYEGRVLPEQSDWLLSGVVDESIENNELFVLDKTISGDYDTGEFGFYTKYIDLSLPVTASISSRFLLNSLTNTDLFSGIGLGFHNNSRFFIIGLITVNNIKHLGLMKSFTDPNNIESWQLGLSSAGSIISSTSLEINASDLPQGVDTGIKFQITAGSQQGVYTIKELIFLANGKIEIQIDEVFPANYELWENDLVTIYYQFNWDSGKPFSLRMVVDFDTCVAESFVYGSLTGSVGRLEKLFDDAQPSSSLFNFDVTDKGQVFWGHLTRNGLSTTKWSFLRYSITPIYSVHMPVISYDLSMSELPELINCGDWFKVQQFGRSYLNNTEELIISSEYSNENLDLTFGYSRLETLFVSGNNVDVDFVFKEIFSSSSYNGSIVKITDGNKVIHFSALTYAKSTINYLFDRPKVSLYGFSSHLLQGWNATTIFSSSVSINNRLLNYSAELNQIGFLYKNLTSLGVVYQDDGSRHLQFRLRINSYTQANNTIASVGMGVSVPNIGSTRDLSIVFTEGGSVKRLVIGSGNTIVNTVDFDWDDGEFHTYSVKYDGTSQTGVLLVDDIVLINNIAYASLLASTDNNRVYFGKSQALSEVDFDLEYIFCLAGLPQTVYRTVGIWKGGDPLNINSWEIPRTDLLSVDNSNLTSVIEQMNFSNLVNVRLHLDGSWGVTLLRPDIALPPTSSDLFATAITNVSNSWLHLEYVDLPNFIQSFGNISFGCLDSEVISSNLWDRVNYRIYKHINNDYRSSSNMVLNQANSVNSGEYTKDVTLEDIIFLSENSTTVNVWSANISAGMIYRVYEEDLNYIHAVGNWVFDVETQVLKLTSGTFAGEHVRVRIIFLPSLPITKSYLEAQPFNQGQIILNEDTPPFYKSLLENQAPIILNGSMMNDEYSLMNDSSLVLNETYEYVYTDPNQQAQIHCLEECVLEEEGEFDMLSSICDELFDISLFGGSDFYENISIGTTQIGNLSTLMTYAGNGTPITTYNNSIFWTNYSPNGQYIQGGLGGLNNDITIVIDLISVVVDDIGTEQLLEEEIEINEEWDNVPPSQHADQANSPDGPPGVNQRGACLVTIEETTLEYSVYGPYNGVDSLSPYSLYYGVNPNQLNGIPSSGFGMMFVGGSPLSSVTTSNTFYVEST